MQFGSATVDQSRAGLRGPRPPPGDRPGAVSALFRSCAVRWAIAGAAVLVFALAFQGSRPLWEPDEGRYVAVALEMIQLDDYLVPRLHHQYPHFAKPPLTYWAITACVRTLGAGVGGADAERSLTAVLLHPHRPPSPDDRPAAGLRELQMTTTGNTSPRYPATALRRWCGGSRAVVG
jgi:hypothetical protein